jgi:endonuclease/exonuclease/phosphatase family metal-dependent hydrolase
LIDKLWQRVRRVRRAISRTRWTARLLRRPKPEPSDEPGLVILQIDGLSRTQFEAALAKGRLPKLARLIRSGHYEPLSFYSGLPSTTPAVQGEVMYGVRAAVPAFQFLDRAQGQVVRMFDDGSAERVAAQLAAQGEPLLAGGCSYSNIYAGGADDARFCAETLDDERQRLFSRPGRLALLAVMYAWTILRVIGLALLELVLAVGDMIRGVAGRESWKAEFHFIASRIAVSIVMREYLRVIVKLAIEEGRPIVYANFLGYDEQAHRRGPDSWFAHWVLKGIDGVIGDISREARRSPYRDYEVVVFSDHGQERAEMYSRVRGRDIEAAVRDALADGPLAQQPVRSMFAAKSRGSELDQRARRLLRIKRGREKLPQPTTEELGREVIVTALGPLGHIYSPQPLSDEAKDGYARELVAQDRVPTALYRDAAGVLWARNRRGRWRLPEDAAHVLGPEHPFLDAATEDLIALCQHENAGDLVISGWDPAHAPVTFVDENGAHGSFGVEELRGFALVPDAVRLQRRRSATGEEYIRGEDLYHAARHFLGRNDQGRTSIDDRTARVINRPVAESHAAEPQPATFRVMTYNIHSCIGLDGRVRPERVARVIRAAGADIIALQEVDAYRARSRHADQARFLADELEMSHHYYAVLEDRGEQYGLAVISRYPLDVVQTAHLTSANVRRRCEARGAMWVEIDAPFGPLQVINTHFGLTREERVRQAAALAGEQWLGKIAPHQPVVLCGDLNSGPKSPACRTLAEKLVDVQHKDSRRGRQASFPSVLSVRRIDHIFVSRHFRVAKVLLPRTPTAVMASDHLPVCADLKLVESVAEAAGDDAGEVATRVLARPPGGAGG